MRLWQKLLQCGWLLFCCEVFGEDGQLRHFVDGRGSSSSWMSYVNCARCPQEQNLDMVQSRDGNLYYDVIDDIPCNTELLVRLRRTMMMMMMMA